MNCSDMTRILDAAEDAKRSVAAASQADAHAATCERCADQQLAERAVATLRTDVPPLPAALQARARQLQDRFDARAAGRPTRRPLLIGSLLLFGAAATMFAIVPGPDDRAMT